MMKKIWVMVLMLCAFSTSAFGFATVVTTVKGGDSITFDSNVTDVQIYLNNQLVGSIKGNSFIYKLKRDGESKSFTFKKAGYKDVSLVVSTSLDPLFWGNIVTGGSLGSSTDSILTRNAYEYSPNQFYVNMEKG